jgi:hypothetical protein
MNQDTTVNLLNGAANEIVQLRQSNALMAARLDMFDKMVSIFQTVPFSQGMGYSPDIVYDIRKQVAEIESANKEKPE